MKPAVTAMTVAELDQWIAEAIKERCKRKVATAVEPEKTVEATAFSRPRATRLPDGQTLLQLRHAGAGWVSFLINADERAALLSQLLQHALLRTEPVAARQPDPPGAAPSLLPPAPSEGGGKPH